MTKLGAMAGLGETKVGECELLEAVACCCANGGDLYVGHFNRCEGVCRTMLLLLRLLICWINIPRPYIYLSVTLTIRVTFASPRPALPL